MRLPPTSRIEGMAASGSCRIEDLVGGNVEDLSFRIYEPSDQPWTSDAVGLRTFTRYPEHDSSMRYGLGEASHASASPTTEGRMSGVTADALPSGSPSRADLKCFRNRTRLSRAKRCMSGR